MRHIARPFINYNANSAKKKWEKCVRDKSICNIRCTKPNGIEMFKKHENDDLK